MSQISGDTHANSSDFVNRHDHLRARRRVIAVAGLALVLIASLGGCVNSGDQSPVASGLSPGATGSAAAPAPPPDLTLRARPVVYPHTSDIGADPPATFACRVFKLQGSYTLESYTDQLCCLRRNRYDLTYPESQLCLLDPSSGALHTVLSRPVNARARFEIMETSVSDRWLAWVEISPGDDLRFPAHWRLYAARISADRVSLRAPFIVDKGYTPQRERPLFHVDGNRLAWSTVSGSPAHWHDTLRIIDLRRRSVHIAYRTPEGVRIDRPSLDGDSVWFSTPQSAGSSSRVLRVYSASSGRPTLVLPLNNGKKNISDFHDFHDGWFAWAVYARGYAHPMLYVREPGGRVHKVKSSTGVAVAADYMIFLKNTVNDELPVTTWALDLKTMRQFEMPDLTTTWATQGSWGAPSSNGYCRRLFVVANDERGFRGQNGKFTYLRVYDLTSLREGASGQSPQPAPTVVPTEVITAGL